MSAKRTQPGAARRRRIPRQARSQHTVRAILSAAADLIQEKGYAAVTTNEIARRAGVSIGSVYQYFPDRQAIAAALLERVATDVAEQIRAHTRESFELSLEEALARNIRMTIELYENSQFVLFELAEQAPELRELSRSLGWEYLTSASNRAWFTRFQDETDVEDPELARYVIETLLVPGIRKFVIDAPAHIDKQTFAAELTKLALRYLGAGQETRTG